jgi:hypothetical protein
MKKYLTKYLLLILVSMTTISVIGQTKDETLDYINTKQEVYKHKNNYGDIYQYAINISDSNGVKSIVIVEIAAIAGTIIRQDYYFTDVKNITAVEFSLDEIGRKQIKIFTKGLGFTKLNLLDNEESYETIVELTFSSNTESEQIKSLIKSYKHLIKLMGGKDLSIEKF